MMYDEIRSVLRTRAVSNSESRQQQLPTNTQPHAIIGAGGTGEDPIIPCCLHLHDKRLSLGALAPLHAKLMGVHHGCEPHVAVEVGRGRECSATSFSIGEVRMHSIEQGVSVGCTRDEGSGSSIGEGGVVIGVVVEQVVGLLV